MPKYVITVLDTTESPRIVGDIHGASVQKKSIMIRIRPRLEDPIKIEEVTNNIKNIKFRNKEQAEAVVRKILKGEYTPSESRLIANRGPLPPRIRSGNPMARG